MSSCRFDPLLAMVSTLEGAHAMPVFYRGPDAQITQWELVWHSPSRPQRFTIRDLREVRVEITEERGSALWLALRGRRHSYELHALYRGRPTCLYRTTDERIFGQVRRGLIRALDAAEGPAFPHWT